MRVGVRVDLACTGLLFLLFLGLCLRLRLWIWLLCRRRIGILGAGVCGYRLFHLLREALGFRNWLVVIWI